MESGYEKLNFIKKKIGLYIAGLMLCLVSICSYNSKALYAQEETQVIDKTIKLNYTEVTMFPSQSIKLELQGDLLKGEKLTLEEYNKRIGNVNPSNPTWQKDAWGGQSEILPDEGFYGLETTFVSDNEKVLVSEDGVVTLNGEITDVISAKISVNYKYLGKDLNLEGTCVCTVFYDNGKILGDDIVASGLTSYYFLSTTYTIGEVKWSVDNENIAIVSSEGILTTKAYGSVVITVTVKDNDKVNTITRTIRVSDPKFNKTTEALAVGGSFIPEITGVYEDSVKTYSSSKSKYVSVSKDGMVYSIKKTSKDVTISAVVDGRKITMTIKVTNPKFSNGEAKPILLIKGKKLTITVTGLVDGLSKLKYSSDKTNIATVTKKGRVKAKKYGSCFIVAEVDHKIVKINCAVGKKKAIKAIKSAYAVYGCPYSQPKRMNAGYYDCSSLVWRSYKKVGFYVANYRGRWASTAAEECKYLFGKHKRVSYKGCSTKKLRPGDLVFYSGWKNGRYRNITHVAMYVGNDTLIEANWPNGVREASYAKNKAYIVGIGRPIK